MLRQHPVSQVLRPEHLRLRLMGAILFLFLQAASIFCWGKQAAKERVPEHLASHLLLRHFRSPTGLSQVLKAGERDCEARPVIVMDLLAPRFRMQRQRSVMISMLTP
jgi:hypothetical protein